MSARGWSTLTATRYCRCGASVTVRSAPAEAGEFVLGVFDAAHHGTGHGEASQAEAARARRRNEASEVIS